MKMAEKEGNLKTIEIELKAEIIHQNRMLKRNDRLSDACSLVNRTHLIINIKENGDAMTTSK